MMAHAHVVEWAFQQSSLLLEPLGNRWLHVQGVVKRAEWVSALFDDEDDRSQLVAAAYLHDIGYAPSLAKTGFHPLDGANYLLSLGEHRLASLVAYHSGAQFEARLRGFDTDLAMFPCEHSLIAATLTYCDMTTNSIGEQVTFQERLNDIFSRYDSTHMVHQAISEAVPLLRQKLEWTQKEMGERGFVSLY